MPPYFESPSAVAAGAWPAFAQLRVHLADMDGKVLPRSLVALRRARGHLGPDLPCRFDVRTGCYVGPSVPPGVYLLIAHAKGFVAQRRSVGLVAGVNETTVMVSSKRGQTLRRGDTVVPLDTDAAPRVAVQLDMVSEDGARQVLDAARALRLEARPSSRELARAGVMVFDVPPTHHLGSTPGVQHDRMRGVLLQLSRTPGVRHAGVVVRASAGGVAFLTQDVVVRMAASATPHDVETVAATHGFDVKGALPFGKQLWHLRTDEMPTFSLLARMEALAEDDQVELAEASLVVAGGADAPPSVERAPRDPADGVLARLPAAQSMVQQLTGGDVAATARVVVVASHGIDQWGSGGAIVERRGALGSDLDIATTLAVLATGADRADVVVLLPAVGAGLPPSHLLRCAIDLLATDGRQGRGAVLLAPHVLPAASGEQVLSIEQPLALHPAVVVVNASTVDAAGVERVATGVGGSTHVGLCAPARALPAGAAPAAAALLVAEIVQLMMASNAELSGAAARRILRATAERIDPDQDDSRGGWLDAHGEIASGAGTVPVFSQWYGYGRVDAVRAAAAARSRLMVEAAAPLRASARADVAQKGTGPEVRHFLDRQPGRDRVRDIATPW